MPPGRNARALGSAAQETSQRTVGGPSLKHLRSGERAVWELNSYRDLLSENSGDRHVIGSALIMLAVVAVLLVAFA